MSIQKKKKKKKKKKKNDESNHIHNFFRLIDTYFNIMVRTSTHIRSLKYWFRLSMAQIIYKNHKISMNRIRILTYLLECYVFVPLAALSFFANDTIKTINFDEWFALLECYEYLYINVVVWLRTNQST